MLSFTPFISKSIVVGKDALLPVSHNGHTFYPFSQNKFMLKYVILSRQILKNLVSVCKFTIDNSISITFDAFSFLLGILILENSNNNALILETSIPLLSLLPHHLSQLLLLSLFPPSIVVLDILDRQS